MSASDAECHWRIAISGSACALMMLINALEMICCTAKEQLAVSAMSMASSILQITALNGSSGFNYSFNLLSVSSNLIEVTFMQMLKDVLNANVIKKIWLSSIFMSALSS